MIEPSPSDRRPLIAALICFTLWGVFPLLFQAMGQAGAKPFETFFCELFLEPGDEVLLPALTFVATANAAMAEGQRAAHILITRYADALPAVIDADLLGLLTDTPGLLSADPALLAGETGRA